MLPNHAPLTIAEQFGTLDDAAPGPHRPRPRPGPGQRPGHDARPAPRPDVGGPLPAGRARAAGLPRRADPRPGRRRHPRARAPTSRSTSSARRCSAPQLAAALGLPYAFASHFAPAGARGGRRHLPPRVQALGAARRALRHRRRERRRRRHRRRGPGAARAVSAGSGRSASSAAAQRLTDEEADPLLAQGAAHHSTQMLHHPAVGTPAEVRRYLDDFASTPTPTS